MHEWSNCISLSRSERYLVLGLLWIVFVYVSYAGDGCGHTYSLVFTAQYGENFALSRAHMLWERTRAPHPETADPTSEGRAQPAGLVI